MEVHNWPFRDPENTAVIVNKKIFYAGNWIAWVSHDIEDGCWQFHIADSGDLNEEDAAVVSLRSVVDLDFSVSDLSDLPAGWYAWRKTKEDAWATARSVDPQ